MDIEYIKEVSIFIFAFMDFLLKLQFCLTFSKLRSNISKYTLLKIVKKINFLCMIKFLY